MKTKLLILASIICSVGFGFEIGNKEQICKSMCDARVKEALESQSFKQDSKDTSNLAEIEIVDIPNESARKAFEDSLFENSKDSKTSKINNEAICRAKIFHSFKGIDGIYFDDSVIKANSNGVIDDIKGSKYDLVSLGLKTTQEDFMLVNSGHENEYSNSSTIDYAKNMMYLNTIFSAKYVDMRYDTLKQYLKIEMFARYELKLDNIPKDRYYRIGWVDYRDNDEYYKHDKFGTCKDKKLNNNYCLFIYDIPKKEVSKISPFIITYYPIKSEIIKKEIPYSPNLFPAQEETGIKLVGTYTLTMIGNKPLWIRINSNISFVALTRFYALKYDDNLQAKEIILLAEHPLYQGVECDLRKSVEVVFKYDILGN
ncbi:hypothetical protein CQA53_10115 [Helicobacter didelphidarum]|uniref:Uncharacterized protein n=1 Tax=Helicobacter didelphidarum TaxID=2040648 RepID=A0A3D8I8K1_9HELI|nr:hypothetical protein [Helicobacter didelphidarum]RDU61438.1 hypothetical protein CQA53_10115 [Helicobacter didelphidarum]